jgi:hypothetical protein
LKVHFLERDSRRNDSDFKETMGSFSVINSILEKGLRKLGAYTDNIFDADAVGISDSLALNFLAPYEKLSFGIYFVDCINTLSDIQIRGAEENPDLLLFSINKHTADIFRKFGFECRVIGKGIDTDFWFKTKEKNSKFTFIHSGFSNFRSGLDLLIKAYDMAFRGNNDVQLIIKNTSSSKKLEEKINEYINRGNNIIYINRRTTFSEMRDLYSQAHVGCNIFRHSAHGLPIIEMQYCECDVLVGDFDPSNKLMLLGKKLKPKAEISIFEKMPELVDDWGLTNTFAGLTFPETPLFYDYNIEEYSELLKQAKEKYCPWTCNCNRAVLSSEFCYEHSAKKLLDEFHDYSRAV